MARRALFAWLIAVLALDSFSQCAFGQDLLTPNQMAQDLGYMADLFRRVHPQPFHATSEQDFEDLLGALAGRTATPLPRDEFFFILRELTNALKEVHTEVQNSEHDYLPVRFYWAEDGLAVTGAADGTGLETGDKIITIGGRDRSTLQDQLTPIIATDNVYWLRDRVAEVLSRGSFLRHLHLVDQENTVRLVAEDRNGQLKEVRIGLTPSPPPSDARPFYGWSIDEPHDLGVFYLDQCIFSTGYQSALQQFFEEVRRTRVRFIVFDVRRNPGGDSRVASELLRYVPVRPPGWLPSSSDSTVRGFLSDIKFSPEAAEQRGYPFTTGYYWANLSLRLTGGNLMPITPPPSPDLIFTGPVFIFTAGHTCSSANLLATLFRDNQLGLIVGEPTGSMSSYYGDTLNFKTPNGQFSFILSHRRFYRPDYTKDSLDAVFPDLYLPTRVNDIRAARDAQMTGLLSFLASLRPATSSRGTRAARSR